jgi:putative transposase
MKMPHDRATLMEAHKGVVRANKPESCYLRPIALRQAEVGTSAEQVCRKMGISDTTFHNWRKKYGGLGPSALRRLKQLEEESAKLKRPIADLSLDNAMLQDLLAKEA